MYGLLLAVLLASNAAAGEGLMEATAWIRGLDEAALVKLVPEQSGLRYVGCPNCAAGRQERQLEWSPDHPGEVRCQFCRHAYPSAKYPMRAEVTVRNPRGEVQHYPYWEDGKGYRYFFAARRDDAIRLYLAEQTANLARLYSATGDRAHARRAALLLDRFAQVFPGWCYHYDFPFHQKIIYDGDVPPSQFRPGFRTARWNWWAYHDVPIALVEAYDAIRPAGVLDAAARQRIERDLFRNAAAQVLANPETYGNMSPIMWQSLIALGRVIGEPAYARECTRRLREFVARGFFYDNVWHEGSPSYHAQTLGALGRVVRALGGVPDLEPLLASSEKALAAMRLPNGRYVPVHDTWSEVAAPPPAETHPWLLPALGHACLGGGSGGAQTQWHLTWSGGYGHEHADQLSLLLFAGGRELLSDLGYTHTRYRPWTLATAAHNTVVIDENNQAMGPADGALRWFDASDPAVQSVSADGVRGYPGRAGLYRRTLLVVDAGQGRSYAVDLFEVEGGATHDYFLHGDADRPTELRAAVPFTPLGPLGPANWQPTTNEGEIRRVQAPGYAYGFLSRLRGAALPPGVPVPVTFHPGLRVTLVPEAHSRLVAGENPAVRGAGEDDARLPDFRRSFLMLRHTGPRSRFVSVIEPYGSAPFIDAVEPLEGAPLALRIRMGDRADLVVCGAARRFTAGGAGFRGDAGVLITRAGKPEHAYALGEGGWSAPGFERKGRPLRSAELAAAEPRTLVLASPARVAAGDVVRLVTADGWVYPYTVETAEGNRLRVAEGPGFRLERGGRGFRFTAYPQRQHAGVARVEWFER